MSREGQRKEFEKQFAEKQNPKKSEQMKVQTEPGDNSKYLAVSMQLFNLPAIDIRNDAQVSQRLNEYFQIHFENDMKPTVAGMALALGISRQQLWSIKTGKPYGGGKGYEAKVPTSVSNNIKKAYVIMENLWENYMQNGKINPVSGIFLGKNNFGYQDKTEIEVSPTIKNDSDYDIEEIKERYSSDYRKRLSDGSSTMTEDSNS